MACRTLLGLGRRALRKSRKSHSVAHLLPAVIVRVDLGKSRAARARLRLKVSQAVSTRATFCTVVMASVPRSLLKARSPPPSGPANVPTPQCGARTRPRSRLWRTAPVPLPRWSSSTFDRVGMNPVRLGHLARLLVISQHLHRNLELEPGRILLCHIVLLHLSSHNSWRRSTFSHKHLVQLLGYMSAMVPSTSFDVPEVRQ
jgi:hypothetical protein